MSALPERHRIVLDEQFYAALEPAEMNRPAPRPRGSLDRTAGRWPRVWHVVLLALTTVSALTMIAFALLKAVLPAVLCMLALIVVKAVDHWHGRRCRPAR